MHSSSLVFLLLTLCAAAAQEKDIDLDALSFGQMRVRPQTVARTQIPAQGGATLLIGSPHPLTISLLDPANASAHGFTITSQPVVMWF